MKTISSVIIGVLLLVSAVTTSAQGKYKFGHIDQAALLEVMPERNQAVNDLQKYATELEETLSAMQKEFEQKYTEYVSKADSMSSFIRKNKEEELQIMNQRIEEFKMKANQDVQAKEAELLQPILEKAGKAIKEVAKEQGLIYVFDVAETTGGVVVLYHSEDSMDLLPLVKKKMGIQ
ncbi:MAG: molecular chaperone Skp [Marinilabiliales bacterium]|nr:MAG: molecular chaperone Skp [Marinilabiliales bacterium]